MMFVSGVQLMCWTFNMKTEITQDIAEGKIVFHESDEFMEWFVENYAMDTVFFYCEMIDRETIKIVNAEYEKFLNEKGK